jgi:hypothetical protein
MHICSSKALLPSNTNVFDKWKGNDLIEIPFSYCDHDKHLFATKSPSRRYERNWEVLPSINSSSHLGLGFSGYRKDLYVLGALGSWSRMLKPTTLHLKIRPSLNPFTLIFCEVQRRCWFLHHLKGYLYQS